MGLDMFLDGVNYIPAKFDENRNIIEKRKIIKTLEIDWRNAHQIHNWFVRNIQWGEDDCNSYELTEEQLIELLDTCEKVLNSNNNDKAKNLLPNINDRYDNYYFEQIKDTIKKIKRVLKYSNIYDWFEYRSSW